VLKLAAALDPTKRRARLPAEASRRFGPANSVPGVDEVSIQRAKSPAVQVIVRLRRPGALPAVEAFLHHKLQQVPLAGLVEVLARLDGQPSICPLPLHVWHVEAV
jgi:metal-dependent HD superfamily phosphatase/phosphodiesterase